MEKIKNVLMASIKFILDTVLFNLLKKQQKIWGREGSKYACPSQGEEKRSPREEEQRKNVKVAQ